MKRILSFYYIKLFVFCQALVLFCTSFIPIFTSNVSAANANNFYFEDAVFDYYLEKNEDGTSRMHVQETLTAVFPDSNQNHGITRYIPYTNQDGANVTVESKNALNFKVTRNGQPEDIAKTENENNAYVFYVGKKNSYVHGRQVYVLDYDFTNVITEFNDKGELTYSGKDAIFQELYWDTNGTGWSQKFQKLTANLHLPKDTVSEVLTDKTSCYVGRYGESGKNRCFTSSAENIISFTTSNLAAGENLTFAVDFEPGTFTVNAPRKSPLLLIVTILSAFASICIISLTIFKYNQKNKEKKSYYKGLFVAPQYQPHKDISVAEAEQICLKSVKSSKVATLLELAVNRKIQIKQAEKSGILKKKNNWSIIVQNTDGLTKPQTIILKLLNGGTMPKKDEEFKIKTQTYSSTLATLNRSYPESAQDLLKSKKYFEEESKKKSYAALATLYFVAHIILVSVLLFAIASPTKKYLYGDICYGAMFTIDILGVIISIFLSANLKDYARYTTKGLDLVNYYEGLKLYISMAEKDRLKFMQSVKGADTSDKGIVKLYEKLLPYACLFGEEESWMNELNKYYQNLDYDPYWYHGDGYLTGYMLGSMISTTNSSITSATVSPSSSGSSGSSGGGGGGFSGGGGGGGGGGGW